MPRRLSNDDCCVSFSDKISGSSIQLFHRLPSTEERTGYEAEMWERDEKTGKLENHVRAARRKYGEMILTGFRDGDFEDEQGKPIASDKSSEHYREDWKALVMKYGADLVEVLAVHVFEPNYNGKVDPKNDPF